MSWVEEIKKSSNSNVLLMLSGGKDSIAALFKLLENNINVTAIHFRHEWMSDITTNEAIRFCSKYGIKLIIENFTEIFFNTIKNSTGGRPCLICKKAMYKCLIGKYLKNGEYGWVCIGDSANDKTTINRMKEYLKMNSKESLYCSSYFGSEMGIKLPSSIKIVRPVIDMNIIDIEGYLKSLNVHVKRINSTGDKYFDYHREGCSAQFVDYGVKISKKYLDDLKRYNNCITSFAREHNILASVHIPSTFIVTVPRGYEIEAGRYLEWKGFYVDWKRNSYAELKSACVIYTYIGDINNIIFYSGVYIKLFKRFSERLEIVRSRESFLVNGDYVLYKNGDLNNHILILYDFKNRNLNIAYMNTSINDYHAIKCCIENLVIELFRTRKYQVVCNCCGN